MQDQVSHFWLAFSPRKRSVQTLNLLNQQAPKVNHLGGD